MMVLVVALGMAVAMMMRRSNDRGSHPSQNQQFWGRVKNHDQFDCWCSSPFCFDDEHTSPLGVFSDDSRRFQSGFWIDFSVAFGMVFGMVFEVIFEVIYRGEKLVGAL